MNDFFIFETGFFKDFLELKEWNFFERRYIHKCEALMFCRPFVRQNE